MEKVGKAIVKLRIPILILSVLLLIPAGIGYVKTKVNYDILYYLPGDIDTMKGQDILMDEFNKGAYATVVVKGMDAKGIEKIEDKIENVEHVTDIISYNSMVGAEVPTEIIPSKYRSYFENQESVVYGSSQANNSQEVNAMFGGFFFIVISLSIIFIVGAVLVIYYKQISEGYEDRERFVILQKVGLDQK